MMTRYSIPAKKGVSWGRKLEDVIRDTCRDELGIYPTDLFQAVAAVTGDSKNSIRQLQDLDDVPGLDSAAGRKNRSRAVALLLAIDASPESFDLTEDDLSPTLQRLGSRRVRKAIRDGWVAGESNPEPADSGQISDLTCVRASSGR